LRGCVVAGVVLAAALGHGVVWGASFGPRGADAPPLVIAHRGASASAPEHTTAAYDLAIEQHADVLECDLQLTADEVLVCMHDTTVDRTTGGAVTGRVDAFTVDDLRTMDFGSWFGPEFAGARIVTFEEQLRCYSRVDPSVQFYAETKAPGEYGGRMEPRLVELLDRLGMVPEGEADPRRSRVIVQSFDLASLNAVKRLAPSLPTAWLWVAPPAGFAEGTVPRTVDVVAPMADVLRADPELVRKGHHAGREVHTWTVDDAAEMDELLAAGVDGIFTNRPDVLRGRVDARTPRPSRRTVTVGPGCRAAAGTAAAGRERRDGAAASPSADSSDATPWWLVIALAVVAVAAVGVFGWLWQSRRRQP
jgi:glycerophosphoryl diester phosphodiesterase